MAYLMKLLHGNSPYVGTQIKIVSARPNNYREGSRFDVFIRGYFRLILTQANSRAGEIQSDNELH